MKLVEITFPKTSNVILSCILTFENPLNENEREKIENDFCSVWQSAPCEWEKVPNQNPTKLIIKHHAHLLYFIDKEKFITFIKKYGYHSQLPDDITEQMKPPIYALPNEVLTRMGSFFDLRTLTAASQVNRDFNNVFTEIKIKPIEKKLIPFYNFLGLEYQILRNYQEMEKILTLFYICHPGSPNFNLIKARIILNDYHQFTMDPTNFIDFEWMLKTGIDNKKEFDFEKIKALKNIQIKNPALLLAAIDIALLGCGEHGHYSHSLNLYQAVTYISCYLAHYPNDIFPLLIRFSAYFPYDTTNELSEYTSFFKTLKQHLKKYYENEDNILIGYLYEYNILKLSHESETTFMDFYQCHFNKETGKLISYTKDLSRILKLTDLTKTFKTFNLKEQNQIKEFLKNYSETTSLSLEEIQIFEELESLIAYLDEIFTFEKFSELDHQDCINFIIKDSSNHLTVPISVYYNSKCKKSIDQELSIAWLPDKNDSSPVDAFTLFFKILIGYYGTSQLQIIMNDYLPSIFSHRLEYPDVTNLPLLNKPSSITLKELLFISSNLINNIPAEIFKELFKGYNKHAFKPTTPLDSWLETSPLAKLCSYIFVRCDHRWKNPPYHKNLLLTIIRNSNNRELQDLLTFTNRLSPIEIYNLTTAITQQDNCLLTWSAVKRIMIELHKLSLPFFKNIFSDIKKCFIAVPIFDFFAKNSYPFNNDDENSVIIKHFELFCRLIPIYESKKNAELRTVIEILSSLPDRFLAYFVTDHDLSVLFSLWIENNKIAQALIKQIDIWSHHIIQFGYPDFYDRDDEEEILFTLLNKLVYAYNTNNLAEFEEQQAAKLLELLSNSNKIGYPSNDKMVIDSESDEENSSSESSGFLP